MDKRLIFVHALSPLHAGTGQGVGIIDLPIAREKATGLPYLPGSSLKGTLRDRFPKDEDKEKNKFSVRVKLFGPESEFAADHAGAIQFTDQTLLLLPVRSLAGTFAWVTSPYILQRLKRDAKDADADGLPLDIPAPSDVAHCIVAPASALIVSGVNRVCLEDLDLEPEAEQSAHAQAWADWLKVRIFPADSPWRAMLAPRLCLVHDDVLAFILDTATEITARIKMDGDSKTVDKKTGALWYEEALPTESVLFGIALAFPNKQTGMNDAEIFAAIEAKLDKALQLGGKATVGRGICRVSLSDGAVVNGG